MTSVWPALWPPWKRTTMSACSDNQSTILPFPSSPHWAPTTTHSPFRGYSLCKNLCTSMIGSENRWLLFRIMRPGETRPGPPACEASHRIKDAGYRRKQERGFEAALRGFQPIDIPQNPRVRRDSAAASPPRPPEPGRPPALLSSQHFRRGRTGAAAGRASSGPDRAAHGRDASIPLLRDENPCLW